MAERDDLARTLALARQTLRGPDAMKARLRARLMTSGGAASPEPANGSLPAAAPKGELAGDGLTNDDLAIARRADAPSGLLATGRRWLAHRYHLGTVALLVGVGFGAGLWLGRQPSAPPAAQSVADERALASRALETSAPLPARSTSAQTLAREAAPEQKADGLVPAAGRALGDGSGAGARHPEAAIIAGPLAHDPVAQQSATPGHATRDVVHDAVAHDAAARDAATRAAAAARNTPARNTPARNAPAHASATRGSAEHASRARAVSRKRSIPPEERDADSALIREVALLERIERAIRSERAALALALLDELDREVPVPALRDERAAARVLAQCLDGARGGSRDDVKHDSRRDAERFLAQSASSVYVDRIRASCALDHRIDRAPSKKARGEDTERSEGENP